MTHSGVTGNITFDENGDRQVDFVLLDLDPEDNVYKVMLFLFGKSLLDFCFFEVVSVYHGVTSSFETRRSVHWPNRWITSPDRVNQMLSLSSSFKINYEVAKIMIIERWSERLP